MIGDNLENTELVARYTVNENLYRSGGGQLSLRWLRNGQPIEDANASRYRLRREDVGAKISLNCAMMAVTQVRLINIYSR